jgi:hypothetical protein
LKTAEFSTKIPKYLLRDAKAGFPLWLEVSFLRRQESQIIACDKIKLRLKDSIKSQ